MAAILTSRRLHVAKMFDGQGHVVDRVLSVDNGVIVDIDDNTTRVDEYIKGLVVPGFIDLQVNGGGGALFNDAPNLLSIKTMIKAHSQFGTTAMLPTLITDDIEVMAKAADAMALAIAERVPGILGIHFEGPHLSVAKKGAHIAEHIRPISEREWDILSRQDLGQILVTLAPETVSCEEIERLVALGIKVSLGHSNADYNTAQKAINAGADGFTHLYNAMSPIQGRAPGVTGCALLNDNASCGLIVDGHHVDYASCQLAMKAKPTGSIYLVTDSMPPVGTDESEFSLVGKTVTLTDGKLTSSTGELAGSVLDMVTAVTNAHRELGISLDEAIKMASQYPANYINQGHKRGHLAVGCKADFVVLSDDLTVESTWIAGQSVYEANK